MWKNIIWVGTGSMLGGIFRYLVSECIKRLWTIPYPLGTFFVNMAGCFFLGMLSGYLPHTSTPAHRLFFAVGFCGSFTTFSTFSLENLQLLTTKSYGLLTLNIGLSIISGILFASLGYMLTNK